MKILVIALLIILTVGMGLAQELDAKRPRERYLRPVAVDADTAKRIISAIQTYQKVLASKDYKRLYQECVHSALKKRVTEEQFTKQIATAPDLLGKFFEDVLVAYGKKGSRDADFQIGAMPTPLIPGTLMIQFADRIDAEPKLRWPKGDPLRIQMAPDGDHIKFYDID